ncbi:hypothetical protein TrVFT333_000813 [Trichoderma virens FT-333]|nr:hypothetical protein TrVFT333_000813 [Trichoderma virens FT-333]
MEVGTSSGTSLGSRQESGVKSQPPECATASSGENSDTKIGWGIEELKQVGMIECYRAKDHDFVCTEQQVNHEFIWTEQEANHQSVLKNQKANNHVLREEIDRLSRALKSAQAEFSDLKVKCACQIWKRDIDES